MSEFRGYSSLVSRTAGKVFLHTVSQVGVNVGRPVGNILHRLLREVAVKAPLFMSGRLYGLKALGCTDAFSFIMSANR